MNNQDISNNIDRVLLLSIEIEERMDGLKAAIAEFRDLARPFRESALADIEQKHAKIERLTSDVVGLTEEVFYP